MLLGSPSTRSLSLLLCQLPMPGRGILSRVNRELGVFRHVSPATRLCLEYPRVKVKSESEVTQLCLTLRDPMDCSPLGSSIHGILQALEWVAISFSNA